MSDETKVVWREWYNANAVKQLTEFGTLPRYESMVDCSFLDSGEEVAAELARMSNADDPQSLGEGGKIVILEPEQYAGIYDIDVEYEPRFSASKGDDE